MGIVMAATGTDKKKTVLFEVGQEVRFTKSARKSDSCKEKTGTKYVVTAVRLVGQNERLANKHPQKVNLENKKTGQMFSSISGYLLETVPPKSRSKPKKKGSKPKEK